MIGLLKTRCRNIACRPPVKHRAEPIERDNVGQANWGFSCLGLIEIVSQLPQALGFEKLCFAAIPTESMLFEANLRAAANLNHEWFYLSRVSPDEVVILNI